MAFLQVAHATFDWGERMRVLVFIIASMVITLVIDSAFAQQQQPIPLTGERASLDSDLSKLSMPREAHMAIYNILQAYERQAQIEKLHQQAPPTPAEPPK